MCKFVAGSLAHAATFVTPFAHPPDSGPIRAALLDFESPIVGGQLGKGNPLAAVSSASVATFTGADLIGSTTPGLARRRVVFDLANGELRYQRRSSSDLPAFEIVDFAVVPG